MAKQRRIGDKFHAGSRDFFSTFRPRLGPTQAPIRSLHCPDVGAHPAFYPVSSLSRRWAPPSLLSGPFIVQKSGTHPSFYPVPSLSRRWGPPSLISGPFIVQTSGAHPASYPVRSLSSRLGPTQPPIQLLPRTYAVGRAAGA